MHSHLTGNTSQEVMECQRTSAENSLLGAVYKCHFYQSSHCWDYSEITVSQAPLYILFIF